MFSRYWVYKIWNIFLLQRFVSQSGVKRLSIILGVLRKLKQLVLTYALWSSRRQQNKTMQQQSASEQTLQFRQYQPDTIRENYISISFHIEWDMIVVIVFLSILNEMEFHLVQNWKENCQHDHIPFNLKGNEKNRFLSARGTNRRWHFSAKSEV